MFSILKKLFARDARRAPARRRLSVEALESRWCPAAGSFTWTGAGGDGKWTTVPNWSGGRAFDWPGNQQFSYDSVTFDATSNATCTLDDMPFEALASFTQTSGHTGTVAIDHYLKVGATGGTGLSLSGGTLTVATGEMLTLAEPGITHIWNGGVIAGAGLVNVYNSTLEIDCDAHSLAASLALSPNGANGSFLKLKDGMTDNLTLNGSANTIEVGNHCNLHLDANLSAADAITRGGIVGGNSHPLTIDAGGGLIRGLTNVGGSVLVSVPVINSGIVIVHQKGTATEQDRLVVRGDYNGYSIITSSGGKVTVTQNSRLDTDTGMYFGGTADLEVFNGCTIDSDVDFSGGTLHVKRDSTYTTQNNTTVSFVGDVTLSATSKIQSTWYTAGGVYGYLDQISISGSVVLAGELEMLGTTPANTWMAVITAATISGDFSTFTWVGGTLLHQKYGTSGYMVKH